MLKVDFFVYKCKIISDQGKHKNINNKFGKVSRGDSM